ncbi:MAG TPA: SDR family oxidoreductase [Gemmataceae bacterium]|jgi:thioester reductase-like protein/predicted lipid carrier protein YhbT|nr:SDR family oxidoreductase [Gemmataceae bacterium]
MPGRQTIFLTGATGFLGQYLLCDLISSGRSVAVLVRDSRQNGGSERIGELLASWSERLGRKLPHPTIIAGDLGQAGLGLTEADRHWIGHECRAILHSAASVSFRESPGGEPWQTNVRGLQTLVDVCLGIGLTEWHHVSTAFVCGRRTGHIGEEELDAGQSFHNCYEESKFQGERLLRSAKGLQATFYRPSVIVGDSKTGHTTSYTGLYRFLEMAARLSALHASESNAHVPLRLPLSGTETWNLVTVDWVSRAIVELMLRPECHGRTYHLVSPAPVPTSFLKEVGAAELNMQGVEFAGSGSLAKPSRLEELFFAGIEEYWPYLNGNPVFSTKNTTASLAHLPLPVFDRALVERLIRYASAQRWGRSSRPAKVTPEPVIASGCAKYIEEVFPKQAQRSQLAREAGLNLTVSIELRGPGGGAWSCQWIKGELAGVRHGLCNQAEVVYHSDAATFEKLIQGSSTAQDAFLEEKITITGNLETGLELAVLLGQFLAETQQSGSHLSDN